MRSTRWRPGCPTSGRPRSLHRPARTRSIKRCRPSSTSRVSSLVGGEHVPVDRQELFDAILPLEVWDTHTHLRGAALAARSFWDVGHYFWFLRELLAAGYPADYRSLSEDERIAAYVRAYHATRNTSMHWVVERIFRDLY